MAGTSWDGIYSKLEPSPLDRFKNKNRILKSFGPEGVRVYDELDGARSAREAQEACGVESGLFERILTQLLSDGAISLSASVPLEGSKSTSPSRSEMPPGPSMAGPIMAPPPRSSMQPPPGWPPAVSSQIRASPPPGWPGVNASGSPPQNPAFSPSSSARTPDSASIRGPPPSSPPSAPGSPPPAGSAPPNLSPLEKLIFDKYGPAGLKVYELIDGERTAEDILNETGLSESKLVEVLEFMNEQGIIKLDRPLRSPPSSPPPGYGGAPPSARPPMMGSAAAPPNSPYARPPPASPSGSPGASSSGSSASASSSEDSTGFKPMVESGEDSPDSPMSPDALPVDVPLPPSRLSLVQKAKMMAILSTKHGKVGHDLLSHVDGTKDFVQLSLETGLALRDLDVILGELGKSGLLSFKPLTRNEVRHRYGDDGLAIYKRFGRDGLLIYQMIGKVGSLRDIVTRSRIDPQRAVDILIFVHRVLGLELPVDRDMIFRYLTKG